MRFVYIARCNDNSLYTGITKNLKKRIDEHNSSHLGAKYTRNRRPVNMIWSQEVEDRSQASKLEREIKHMTKIQKENLVLQNN